MRNRAHAFLLTVVALFTVAAVAGCVLLLPSSAPEAPAAAGAPQGDLIGGRITAIEQVEGGADDAQILAPGAETLRITVRLDSGRDVAFEMVDETGDTFAVGQQVRVTEMQGADGQLTHFISDVQREQPLAILAAIFLVAVLAFGRWQGLRALIGLGITLAIVVLFMVPAVLDGRDPILVALSASIVIMVATLYLTHGVGPKTTAAAVGTLGALAVTVTLSWSFIELASLTGLADEEARMASVQGGGLSLRGLLLAGIIIGALGVLDDVTMAQSSAVFEFRAADPRTGSPELFRRAMAVGRDHVAATINTLFLAYAGASLPLLILFSGSPDPFNVIVSSEVVAVEIVRTLVGSIGLMASVPLTTLLAAWLAARDGDRVAAPNRPTRADRAAHAARAAVPGPVSGAQPRMAASGPREAARPSAMPDAPDVPPRPRRRRPEPADDEVSVFSDVKPFSATDDAESEWERRLRDSYGLDRLHTARRERDRDRERDR